MAHDILIVDDEPDIRSLIEGILQDEGYETRSARNSDEALASFRQRRPNLVILDIWLQGPQRLAPGTRMYLSVPDAGQRRDIITYLASTSPARR